MPERVSTLHAPSARSAIVTGLPRFLLVGAMKSGTSSLHRLLDADARVYLPQPEIFFFDIDDIEQHPDFGYRSNGTWRGYDWDADFDDNLAWYRDFFRPAQPNQLLGERSTTYLPSRLAPARIARMLPDVRVVIMLREPVSRAYSHYWHLVQKGFATDRFDRMMRRDEFRLLTRGLYREQVERYLEVLPREQLHFMLFEDFVRDQPAGLASVLRFLGLDARNVPQSEERHANKSFRPRSMALQFALNRAFLPVIERRYAADHLPDAGVGRVRTGLLSLQKLAMRVNRSRGTYPPLSDAVRRDLRRFYDAHNAGLEELTRLDLRRWRVRSS